MSNLGELFHAARRFGRVGIYTSENGTYWCNIYFATERHTTLEARSDSKLTPELAVEEALARAQSIVDSINRLSVAENNGEMRLLK